MLDNKTYRILKKLYSRKSIPADEVYKMLGYEKQNCIPPELCVLCSETKYAKRIEAGGKADGSGGWIGGAPYYSITPTGRAYVEETKRTRMNMWVPYAITTFVALLSLAVSIMQLFLDQG